MTRRAPPGGIRALGRGLRRKAFDAVLHGLAGMAGGLPTLRRRSGAYTLTADVVFARHGGESLALDVLRPRGPGPHPAILYIHGGGFAVCSRQTHRPIAALYAARGYLVFNIDYRLAPRHPFPAALQDAGAAWRWLAANLVRFGGDPGRVMVAGESAGANLALGLVLCLCTRRPEPWAAELHASALRPAAALLYCGFLQASRPERYRREGVSVLAAAIARDAAVDYLGEGASDPRPDQALADPLCIVEAMAGDPGLPPVFVAAGEADPVAPDSWRLAAALSRLGVPHALHRYAGETHAFHVMPWRDAAPRCWADTFAFLDGVQARSAGSAGAGLSRAASPGLPHDR